MDQEFLYFLLGMGLNLEKLLNRLFTKIEFYDPENISNECKFAICNVN